jgi:MerR family transcriptional regulator, Zn(II)-responsive regulator of zntA
MTITTLHTPRAPAAPRLGPLQVADLARRADVTPATVRYYARIGLLHPVRDAGNGYRRFSASDLRRVRFIRKAQTLGLSIGDIRAVLDHLEDGDPVCDLVIRLVRKRLEDVRRQLAELEATEARIVGALKRWSAVPEPTGAGAAVCPLIESIDMPGPVAKGTSEPATARARVSRP